MLQTHHKVFQVVTKCPKMSQNIHFRRIVVQMDLFYLHVDSDVCCMICLSFLLHEWPVVKYPPIVLLTLCPPVVSIDNMGIEPLGFRHLRTSWLLSSAHPKEITKTNLLLPDARDFPKFRKVTICLSFLLQVWPVDTYASIAPLSLSPNCKRWYSRRLALQIKLIQTFYDFFTRYNSIYAE